jgi:hypothetical protein
MAVFSSEKGERKKIRKQGPSRRRTAAGFEAQVPIGVRAHVTLREMRLASPDVPGGHTNDTDDVTRRSSIFTHNYLII